MNIEWSFMQLESGQQCNRMVDDISIGQSAVPCIRRQAETE